VSEMGSHVERPIIFPLSNPTSKSEAMPIDLIDWTDGRALVATGSPFPPVVFEKRVIHIGQCNNAFIFPGVGLGVIASGARRVPTELFVAAARALAEFSPALHDETASLFPALEEVRKVSRRVAIAVGLEARRLGVTDFASREELERRVDEKMWVPRYVPYSRAK
jgi:malate dehydrogenase (oxaloacetate-decarboxylating)